MDARGLRGVGMCLRGVFWRWMAMNRPQVAAIERGLCGSLPQRRAAAASDDLCRHQTPRADHVVGESVPQRDSLDLVHAAHKKLRQPAITCLGVGALRGRGALLVDRFGVVPPIRFRQSATPGGPLDCGAWRSRSALRGFGAGTKVSTPFWPSASMSSSLAKPPSARCWRGRVPYCPARASFIGNILPMSEPMLSTDTTAMAVLLVSVANWTL